MDVIDEDGRLLGWVNVVDALVVLVVLAVVVAGATFVFSTGDEPEQQTVSYAYATVDLGSQPTYVVELIDTGDTDTRAGGNVTVTDVYATGSGAERQVRVRIRVPGERTDDGFSYDGAPLRVGRTLDLATSEYQTSGTVTAVDTSTPDLPIQQTDVLLRTQLAADTVDDIRTGEEYRLDGRTVATVRSIEAYRTGDPGQVRAYVGITYQTYRASDGPRFAGTFVREGASLPFETSAYAFTGDVVRVGAMEPRGEQATRTVQLEIENADPDLGDALRAGLSERVRGETVAELTNVSVEPSTMVLTSQDGNVYRREHPVQEDVTLTADLRVHETNAGVVFKGTSLRQGRTVTLDFGTVTVEATVVSVR